MLRRLGYRLVLRSVEHDRAARAGTAFKVVMSWENVGVAPPYRDHRLAFRLSKAGGGGPRILVGETSIRGWHPGLAQVEETLLVPEDLEPGSHDLAIAVVDPATRAPDVRLAIAGREADGWYPVSRVEVLEKARDEPMLTHVDVFTSGADGYNTYRIPAIATAPDGTLLAFAEARKYSAEDPGFGKQDIDLVLKRSRDGGRTWSKMRVIEDPGELWSAANPATLLDRQRGRLWVFYLRSKPEKNTYSARPKTDDVQTLARFSDDSGEKWSEPIDLTAVARDLADGRWRSSVTGPGGAIQDRSGRLIVPVWKFEPWGNFTISSDDHGLTWHRGQAVPGDGGGDEDQLVELADGRILMDYRQQEGPHRWIAESADGGRTWSAPRPGETVSPVCCAIERYTLKSAGATRDRILWTGPRGPERKNLVVRTSYDEGRTFTGERLIGEGEAAYSDITILEDRTVGVLWERGVERGYQFIIFTRFNREFLEPGR
jgi:sialidase-1